MNQNAINNIGYIKEIFGKSDKRQKTITQNECNGKK
jgi:hypothetical protein